MSGGVETIIYIHLDQISPRKATISPVWKSAQHLGLLAAPQLTMPPPPDSDVNINKL